MNAQGGDVSNYTSPFTQEQLDFVRNNWQFAIIGLQSAGKAHLLKQQLLSTGVALEYYVDVPGRDLTDVDPGARVWVDVEVGCFTTIAGVNAELDRLYLAGYVPGIYCNRTSLRILDGNPGEQWAHLPLWVADYRTPDLATFRPFNGWTAPAIWQYSSGGVAGINCDLNISFEEAPVPPPPPERVWLYGTELAGEEVVGNQLFIWHRGVVIDKLGDEDGTNAGSQWHNVGGTFIKVLD